MTLGHRLWFTKTVMNDLTTDTNTNVKPTTAPKDGFRWVQNLMSGIWIQIEIDTPVCCDPSMETYWSM